VSLFSVEYYFKHFLSEKLGYLEALQTQCSFHICTHGTSSYPTVIALFILYICVINCCDSENFGGVAESSGSGKCLL